MYIPMIIAWHWADSDELGPCLNKELTKFRVPIIEGKTYRVEEIPYCPDDLYATSSITQGLIYRRSPYLCQVELHWAYNTCKCEYAAKERKVLWYINAEKIMHVFSCVFIEHLLKRYCITEKYIWDALKLKRDWINERVNISEIEDILQKIADERAIAMISAKACKRRVGSSQVLHAIWHILKVLKSTDPLDADTICGTCIDAYPKYERKRILDTLEYSMRALVNREATDLKKPLCITQEVKYL